jgi:hypothetical protein
MSTFPENLLANRILSFGLRKWCLGHSRPSEHIFLFILQRRNRECQARQFLCAALPMVRLLLIDCLGEYVMNLTERNSQRLRS